MTPTRDEIITKHIPYAVGIVHRLQKILHYDAVEYMSVALEELVSAVDKYEQNRGATLKTHIGNKIRHALIDHYRSTTAWNHTKGEPLKRHPLTATKNLDDYSNTYAVSVNGTEKKVCDRDLAHKILVYVKTIDLPIRKSDPFEAFRAFFMDDLSMSEIAEIQNITGGRVSQIISQITAKVKKRFRQEV